MTTTETTALEAAAGRDALLVVPILRSSTLANASPGWHFGIGYRHFLKFPGSPTPARWSGTGSPGGTATDVPRLT